LAGPSNPVHHGLTGTSTWREVITLTPRCWSSVLWIGLHPQPVVGVLHATVRNLLLQVGPLALTVSAANRFSNRVMTSPFFMAFLPELVLLAGGLALFFVTLGEGLATAGPAHRAATALVAAGAAVAGLGQQAVLFSGAYRVDLFSPRC
jgi:hypothetical protein